jgi:hypothetical protein
VRADQVEEYDGGGDGLVDGVVGVHLLDDEVLEAERVGESPDVVGYGLRRVPLATLTRTTALSVFGSGMSKASPIRDLLSGLRVWDTAGLWLLIRTDQISGV